MTNKKEHSNSTRELVQLALPSILQLANIKLAQSQTLSIDLKAPLYLKYEEDALAVLIQKSGWKPDVAGINTVERKGVS